MSRSETITFFADEVEASARRLGITESEFIYVLECLKHKHVKKVVGVPE